MKEGVFVGVIHVNKWEGIKFYASDQELFNLIVHWVWKTKT